MGSTKTLAMVAQYVPIYFRSPDFATLSDDKLKSKFNIGEVKQNFLDFSDKIPTSDAN